MTIDGTNISTYGLELIKLDNYYTKPARKEILADPKFDENDIKFKEREPVITLFGTYASNAILKTNIDNFYTKIKSSISHNYILLGHELSFSGVIKEGIKVEQIGSEASVKLTFKITINELET